eukprot:Rmarinus@m.27831
MGELSVLTAVVVLHVVICPFTKVEESFNIQAIHDILYFGEDLEAYDHVFFPGVVPRSFIGPISVCSLIWPLARFADLFNIPKIFFLVISRVTLGCMAVAAFSVFQSAVRESYGPKIAKWLVWITCFQFHIPFYMSRTLPNTFAMILVLLAYAAWIRRQDLLCVMLAVFGAVVFRAEVGILFAPVLIQRLVLRNNSTMLRGLLVGAVTLVGSILLTMSVDSFFWQRLCWPELEVFYFNVILNKSGEWGVFPWHWYATAALPKVFTGLVLLFPFSVHHQAARDLLPLAIYFVSLFSLLDHKELRFILCVVPLFNVVIAAGATWIESRIRSPKSGRLSSYLAALTLLGIISISATSTIVATHASSLNYPGANALLHLHSSQDFRHGGTTESVTIHIDSHAAMNGISRFLELSDRDGLFYDKNENVTDFSIYDFLVTGKSEVGGFTPVSTHAGYQSLNANCLRHFASLNFDCSIFQMSDSVYVHINNKSKSALRD